MHNAHTLTVMRCCHQKDTSYGAESGTCTVLKLGFDVFFVAGSLKSFAVFSPVARMKGISLETYVNYVVTE